VLTKNQIKLVRSLHEKKYRTEYGLFLVEGKKGVLELLNSDFEIESLFVTNDFYEDNGEQIKKKGGMNLEVIEEETLRKISFFETNDSALAVVKQKKDRPIEVGQKEIVIALDEIKDPGNLGTILRIADWYGIKSVIASENTVEFYNPKVISASMGSFTRISVLYTDLKEFLEKTKTPIIGTFLNGTDIHKMDFPESGILLMGNESNGIDKELEKFMTKKVTIQKYGGAESLNVSVATAIVLDNWKRKSDK